MTNSFAMKLGIALAVTLSTGCLGEEPGESLDESFYEQELDRGWFGLYLNGIGHTSRTDAAGLFMELTVRYNNQGIGLVVPYAQNWVGSPAQSWLTGLAWANCSDGSQPAHAWNYLLDRRHPATDLIPRPQCPPGTGVNDAYFLLHVDN